MPVDQRLVGDFRWAEWEVGFVAVAAVVAAAAGVVVVVVAVVVADAVVV